MTNEEYIAMAAEAAGFEISNMAMSRGDYIIQNDDPQKAAETVDKFIDVLGALAHPLAPQVLSYIQTREAVVIIITMLVKPPHPQAN